MELRTKRGENILRTNTDGRKQGWPTEIHKIILYFVTIFQKTRLN